MSLQKFGIPVAVTRRYKPFEPDFATYTRRTRINGREVSKPVSGKLQMKQFSSLFDEDTTCLSVCFADSDCGESSRRAAVYLLEKMAEEYDIRAKWVSLTSRLDDNKPALGEVLDIQVIDRLYVNQSSSVRADKARDLVVNAPCLSILISSESDPYIFADKLGIPIDYGFLIKHHDDVEI